MMVGCVALWAQPAPGYFYLPFQNAGQNPGGINTLDEEPAGSGLDQGWMIIHSGPSSNPAWSPIQNVPFTFYFDGQVASQFKVSTSGVLTFSTNANEAPTADNTTLPSSLIPDKSVMVWGLDAKAADDKIAVRVLGKSPNRQMWIQFVNYGYEEGNSFCNMFWSIVLEEGSNNIYIVDQRKALFCSNPTMTLGVQVNQYFAVEVDGSPSIGSLANDDASPSDNSYYLFAPGEQPKIDLEALTLDIDPIVDINDAPFVIKGQFTNIGSDFLISADLVYTIDGGNLVDYHVSNAPNNLLLEHGVPWIPATPGEYDIEFWAANPNGEPDGKPSNNKIVRRITVKDGLPRRQALVESFTQWNCGPCASQNPALDNMLLANPGKASVIKYTGWWPGADNDERHLFNPTDNDDRIAYYNVTGVPRTIFAGNVYTGGPAGISLPMIDFENDRAGVFEIDASLSMANGMMQVNVVATQQADVNRSDLVLRVAVVQDERHYATAPGSNGETEFLDIMRYMVPNEDGTPISVPIGTPVTVTGSYPVDPRFDESFMRVVAFVQGDIDQEIFMSTRSEGVYFCPGGGKVVPQVTATDASCGSSNGSIAVISTGGSNSFTYSWAHDGSTGNTVSNLAPGTYTVNVDDGASCQFTVSGIVEQKDPPKVIAVPETPTCKGDNDGSVNVYVAGGVSPYTYSWSSGETTKDLSNVTPGTYFLTVTDAGGCTAPMTTVTVIDATQGGITGSSSTPDNGTNNGTGTVTAAGGTHPYTFDWSGQPNQKFSTATGLSAGSYTVTVTDYNGCDLGTTTVTVDNNTGLEEDLNQAGIENFEIYPNPSNGILHLNLDLVRPEALGISLFDANGKLVFSQDLSQRMQVKETLSLEALPAGMYMLSLRTSTGSAHTKVVLK